MFRIFRTPPELGFSEVFLASSAKGKARAEFRIESPHVEVLYAILAVDVMNRGALAERDADDPIPVVAKVRLPLKQIVSVGGGYFREPTQMDLGDCFS
jgi:hypothetical protein